ncbi:cation-transporting P-type ATPase [Candidatus Dependentiae bacterium]|nr:cation-transporting P-type ATPase [Candidatus Dependentiae bacterium]
MNYYKYSTYDSNQLEKKFGTSLENGLNDEQVLQKQKTFGKNEIQRSKESWLKIFFRQFNAFIYLLLFASLISLLLGDYINALIIFLITLFNVFLSFIQEYRAALRLELLKEQIQISTYVIRNGQKKIVNSEELVPGDIVLKESGMTISADLRILDANNLTVDESILTGESEPVEKISEPLKAEPKNVYEAKNMLFSSTHISSGLVKAMVIATGADTSFGHISQLTLKQVGESNFSKNIYKLSKFVFIINIITLVSIFILHLVIKGTAVNILELLMFSIALVVGIMPEALPVVNTVALSRGALLLAKKHVLIKRLSSLEDLASLNILCTDKTGTITENVMSVADVFGQPDTINFGALASSEKSNNAFDIAIKNALTIDQINEISQYKMIQELPFDSIKRKNATIVEKNNKRILISRGAFENISSISKKISDQDLKQIDDWIINQGNNARRVLGVAYKETGNETDINKIEKDMEFVGLISFEDPIKKDAIPAIAKAKKLGIQIKMITGDSKEVAVAVGRKIGLNSEVITGEEFQNLQSEEKKDISQRYQIFARFTPDNKFELVKFLKNNDVIGFLGEGINDAPALKIADVSIAVKDATDISKDVADIILGRKSLFVIIEGIETGRIVFANIIKYLRTTLGSNFGNFSSIAIVSLFIDFLPLLPLQILLVNALSDLPMIAISTDHVDNDELVRPQKYNIKEILIVSVVFALTSTLFDLIFFKIFYGKGPQVIQTNWFILSILTELILIFLARTKKFFLTAVAPSKILFLLALIAATITMILPMTYFGQVLFKFKRPNPSAIVIILAIVAAYLITTEIIKLIYYKYFDKKIILNKN